MWRSHPPLSPRAPGRARDLPACGLSHFLQARIQALLRRSTALDRGDNYGNNGSDNGGDLRLRSLLSQREWDVLMELGQGQSNVEIAEALFVSQETIKSHIKALLQKLKAKDRTHAVVIAFQQGWLH